MNKQLNVDSSTQIRDKGDIQYTPKHQKKSVSVKIIPDEYLHWAINQSPTVFKLFFECWVCDGYGNKHTNGEYQYKTLTTTLRGENFRKTRKVLENAGYFKFERITKEGSTYWRVWNCNGIYSGNWKIKSISDAHTTECSIDEVQTTENWGSPTVSGTKISETVDTQAFQKSQRSINEFTKELEKQIIPVGDVAIAKSPTTQTNQIDPIIGTNSYKVEQDTTASSCMGMMPTLDATASNENVEVVGSEEVKGENNQDAVTLDATPLELALEPKTQPRRFTIKTGTEDEQLVTITLTDEEFQRILQVKARLDIETFENYKLAILDDLPEAIVSIEPSRRLVKVV